MNNRHRRVTKLRKQELNALKAKFEKELKWQVSVLLLQTRLFVSLRFQY